MRRGKRIVITDSTLRDGEDAAGVAFTRSDKLAIAAALEQAGVDEIEAGMPGLGPEAVSEVAEIASVLEVAQPIAWCRITRRDVDAVDSTGIRRISLYVPISDLQIKTKLKSTREQVLSRIRDVVSYAVGKGAAVALAGEDSSRADAGFMQSVIDVAAQAGADRYRYADTFGILDPFAVHEIFHNLRSTTDLDLEFHGHDDLGLATANTLSAIRGGATHASVCVLGLGERAGNAPLEEVVAGIKRFSLGKYHVRLTQLSRLSALVADAARKPMSSARKTEPSRGSHGAAPSARAEDFPSVIFGRHSGLASLAAALRSAGFHPSNRELHYLLVTLRERVLDMKRYLSYDEVLDLYQTVRSDAMAPASSNDALG